MALIYAAGFWHLSELTRQKAGERIAQRFEVAERVAALLLQGRRFLPAENAVSFAEDLQRITALHVTVLAAKPAPVQMASTLEPALRGALDDAFKGRELAAATGLAMRFNARDYEGRIVPAGSDGRTFVLLLAPRDDALGADDGLRSFMIVFGLLSLSLTVCAGYILARTITQRVEELTRSAARIQKGDYAAPIVVSGDDEIGLLAGSLQRMREAIARREKEILRLAYADPMTNLPNRTCLMDRLEHALRNAERRGEKLAVMMLDLDRFKMINDALGHAAGDAVLRQVATRLKELVRESDSVGRLGGDEFALVFPAADAEQVRAVARRIARSLRQPLEFEGQPIDINASIGIAEFPQHGSDADTLIRCADTAMYLAKKNGGGYSFYDPRYRGAQLEHLSMLSELRRAVEDNQLRAYYQPKIDIA
ncbi:MAG TPA: diguanylate cyclase, partial [Burkholderiaceae bacterium]|nr:diguanylate cyclase [Burkholderiaceae bacterium]